MRPFLFVVVFCIDALGQNLGKPPAFEVASIRVTNSSDPPTGEFKNGRVTIHNHTLRSILGAAYRVSNDTIQGPDWLDDVRLDISARTDASVSQDAARPMLKALLMERFKLEAHEEQKIQAIYAITIAKGGTKFSETPADAPGLSGCPGDLVIKCHKVFIWALQGIIPRLAGPAIDLPVKDMTGLKGFYDFQLSMEPSFDGKRPSIFDALEEQLGLVLSRTKGTFPVIAIDHIERTPTEN